MGGPRRRPHGDRRASGRVSEPRPVPAPPGGLECGSGLRFHGRGPSCPESSFPLTTHNGHTDGPALPRIGTTGESRGRPGPNVRSGWRGPVPATYQRARDGADPVLEESHLSPSTPTSRKPPSSVSLPGDSCQPGHFHGEPDCFQGVRFLSVAPAPGGRFPGPRRPGPSSRSSTSNVSCPCRIPRHSTLTSGELDAIAAIPWPQSYFRSRSLRHRRFNGLCRGGR